MSVTAPAQMMETQVPFRRMGKGALGGIVATILLHGLLIFTMWWQHRVSPVPEQAPRDVIVTKLVKLGKPVDKFWLPKINQPRRTHKPKGIKVTDDQTAKPAPKDAPKPEDSEVSDKLRKALERARMLQDLPEQDEEGQLDGSELGTATVASEGDAYATKVHQLIKQNWNAPVGILSDEELARASADVSLRIEPDGTLLPGNITRSSNNNDFDESCLEAILATGQVPPPPPGYRGFVLVFEGKGAR